MEFGGTLLMFQKEYFLKNTTKKLLKNSNSTSNKFSNYKRNKFKSEN